MECRIIHGCAALLINYCTPASVPPAILWKPNPAVKSFRRNYNHYQPTSITVSTAIHRYFSDDIFPTGSSESRVFTDLIPPWQSSLHPISDGHFPTGSPERAGIRSAGAQTRSFRGVSANAATVNHSKDNLLQCSGGFVPSR